jgi:hypothetical protein
MAAPERVASGVCRVDAVGFLNVISILLLENAGGWTFGATGVSL